MIDIHFHIVPGVDDGPKTLEDSERILEMASRDGIKKIIATSHRNHPQDFKPTIDYESSLKTVQTLVAEKFPEISVFTGAELYIRDGFENILDSLPYNFTLNNTRYVLIEFPVSVDIRTVTDAVYELKIRNFIPILAHIERYPSLIDQPQELEKLKNEGAFIQVTGVALTGKHGKTIKKQLIKLLKNGFIDFIASDTHSTDRRAPNLSGSYELVVEKTSKQEAERIFIENPERLLKGKPIEKKEIKKSILKRLWGDEK